MAKKRTSTVPPSSASRNGAASSLASWQARSVHKITLKSGQRVKIRIVGMGTILEHDDFPSDLMDLAYMELTAENGATGELANEITKAREAGDLDAAREHIRRYADFQRALVAASLVAVEVPEDEADADLGDYADDDGWWRGVELTIDDLRGDLLPEDDLAMIAEINQRLRAHDARGVRIGVEPIDRWAAFREAHGCPDTDCPGCTILVEQLSSSDVGPL